MKAPVYSYEQLRGVATEFLNERHAAATLPVPIESIIERMGIDIVLQPSLQHICGVDAFVNRGCDAIYVDGEVYLSPNTNRLRSTLAHELAHVILHREQITGLTFSTMAQWKAAWAAIPHEEYAWLEWQAYALAGLLLVPPAQLRPAYDTKLEAAKLKWHGRENEFITSVVVSGLAQHFSVSTDIIERRCDKENLPA